MNKEDKRISELYIELYSNTHASEDFKEKVRTMTENRTKRTIKLTFRATAALAAAIALLTIAGGAIASANKSAHHDYAKIVFNGEERKAAYEYFEKSNMSIWYFTKDNMQYGVTVYGDFDPENQTIYLEDRGDYVIASDSANPELNLYSAIESSSYAEIDRNNLMIYPNGIDNKNNRIRSNSIEIDKADGTADGVIHADDPTYCGQAITILSNGTVAEAFKDPYSDEEEEEFVQIENDPEIE